MSDIQLMKGNEALAEAIIRSGTDAYFGYPITPQSEVLEYLTEQQPEIRTGMVVLQAESEVSAVNMMYGAASAGKRTVTSSSSPGVSLMQEGISYLAAAELPSLVVNVVRGGPGLGSINPSQADYWQTTRGGGHGDYRTLALAPASVQEMADFVYIGYELAFKYRNPVVIMSDGIIGQMMEKVVFTPQVERWTNDQIKQLHPWAVQGKKTNAKQKIIDTVELEAEKHEIFNQKLQDKYARMAREDVMYEEYKCEDAAYVLVAYGSVARICKKTIDIARKEGLKIGLLRPITVFPFPVLPLEKIAQTAKIVMAVEMSAGQMFEDVKLAINGKTNVQSYTRLGGVVPTPQEIIAALKKLM